MFHPGSIVISLLPQADGELKNRPLLLLTKMPGQGDWLVCGISRSLFMEIPKFDEVIKENDSDFKASGLKVASLIRAGFISVLPETRFKGTLGGIKEYRAKNILARLGNYLVVQSK